MVPIFVSLVMSFKIAIRLKGPLDFDFRLFRFNSEFVLSLLRDAGLEFLRLLGTSDIMNAVLNAIECRRPFDTEPKPLFGLSKCVAFEFSEEIRVFFIFKKLGFKILI